MTLTPTAPAQADVSAAPVVAHVEGFIPSTGADSKAAPLFISLDAAKTAGTPLYSIDGEGARTYLPPAFTANVLEIHTIEKDYSGSYEAQTKLVTRLLIGGSTYVLHVGLNSWAGQSLLTSLAQLSQDQMQQQLLIRVVPGRRTCFMRVCIDNGNGWEALSIEDNFLSHRMETEELQILVGSISELL